MKRIFGRCVGVVKLFILTKACRSEMNRIANEAFQKGWNNGYERGHLAGWMKLRQQVKNPWKYPHQFEKAAQ